MKLFHFSFLSLSLAAPLSAAVIVADFESQSAGDLFTGDVPGWTQSSPNPVFNGNPVPLAQVAFAPGFNGGSGSLVGTIGTLDGNNPLAATTTLTTSLGGAAAAGFAVSMNLAIVDDAGDSFPVRDSFGVSISSVGGPTVTVNFTPGAELSSGWDVSYTIGSDPAVSAGAAILAGGEYVFTLGFGNSSFYLSITPAGGGASATSSTAASFTGATFNELAIFHTQEGYPDDLGQSANALLFDNIAIIPEPGIPMLAGVAALGLIRRRRK
jgi:hypothetical protein